MMDDNLESLDVVLPVDDQLPKRGRPVIAWIVIIFLVALVVLLGFIGTRRQGQRGEERMDLAIMELQSRLIVGAASVLERKSFASSAESLNAGSVDQRFRYIVVEGELAGPSEARSALDRLDREIHNHGIELTLEQRRTQALLTRLYQDYTNHLWYAPSLSSSDRDSLRQDLGWFGELALNPEGGRDKSAREAVLRPAQQALWALTAWLLILALFGVAGFAGLVLVLILVLNGALRGQFQSGTPFGGVYAETFAVWMALFILLSIGAHFLPAEHSELLRQGLASALSLMALLWPVIRGVPWRQVQSDVGLTRGSRPALEPPLGAAGYMMTLPLLVVGVIGMFFLMAVQQGLFGAGNRNEFAPTQQPAHPIVQYISGAGWWGPIQILLVASVIAPVVEETMFRGVLYRHLRESSARFGLALSILISAAVNSFIFAVIHPQGIVTVPVLMALAVGFSLIREWRGRVLPCMVAHGIHNGLTSLALIFALR